MSFPSFLAYLPSEKFSVDSLEKLTSFSLKQYIPIRWHDSHHLEAYEPKARDANSEIAGYRVWEHRTLFWMGARVCLITGVVLASLHVVLQKDLISFYMQEKALLSLSKHLQLEVAREISEGIVHPAHVMENVISSYSTMIVAVSIFTKCYRRADIRLLDPQVTSNCNGEERVVDSEPEPDGDAPPKTTVKKSRRSSIGATMSQKRDLNRRFSLLGTNNTGHRDAPGSTPGSTPGSDYERPLRSNLKSNSKNNIVSDWKKALNAAIDEVADDASSEKEHCVSGSESGDDAGSYFEADSSAVEDSGFGNSSQESIDSAVQDFEDGASSDADQSVSDHESSDGKCNTPQHTSLPGDGWQPPKSAIKLHGMNGSAGNQQEGIDSGSQDVEDHLHSHEAKSILESGLSDTMRSPPRSPPRSPLRSPLEEDSSEAGNTPLACPSQLPESTRNLRTLQELGSVQKLQGLERRHSDPNISFMDSILVSCGNYRKSYPETSVKRKKPDFFDSVFNSPEGKGPYYSPQSGLIYSDHRLTPMQEEEEEGVPKRLVNFAHRVSTEDSGFTSDWRRSSTVEISPESRRHSSTPIKNPPLGTDKSSSAGKTPYMEGDAMPFALRSPTYMSPPAETKSAAEKQGILSPELIAQTCAKSVLSAVQGIIKSGKLPLPEQIGASSNAPYELTDFGLDSEQNAYYFTVSPVRNVQSSEPSSDSEEGTASGTISLEESTQLREDSSEQELHSTTNTPTAPALPEDSSDAVSHEDGAEFIPGADSKFSTPGDQKTFTSQSREQEIGVESRSSMNSAYYTPPETKVNPEEKARSASPQSKQSDEADLTEVEYTIPYTMFSNSAAITARSLLDSIEISPVKSGTAQDATPPPLSSVRELVNQVPQKHGERESLFPNPSRQGSLLSAEPGKIIEKRAADRDNSFSPNIVSEHSEPPKKRKKKEPLTKPVTKPVTKKEKKRESVITAQTASYKAKRLSSREEELGSKETRENSKFQQNKGRSAKPHKS